VNELVVGERLDHEQREIDAARQVARAPPTARGTDSSAPFASIVVPFDSHLLGHVSGEYEAHDLVSEVGGWSDHAGTAAVDHRDAVLPPERGGGG
jgi:hypothetical protein